jgi:uncharacterized protein (TIGR02996 family)
MIMPDMTPLYDSEDYWAMLRAVYAHPKKQAPRMLFADWVEERGYFSLALKYRIDAFAGDIAASIRSDREVAIHKPMIADKFWSQVAEIHPAESPVWLELLWRDTAAEKIAKVRGPVILEQTGQGHSILDKYRKIAKQMQVVGLNVGFAKRPDLWTILCDDFSDLQSLNLGFLSTDNVVNLSRISEFHQLRRFVCSGTNHSDLWSSLPFVEFLSFATNDPILNLERIHNLPLMELIFPLNIPALYAGEVIQGLKEPDRLGQLMFSLTRNDEPLLGRSPVSLSRFRNLQSLSIGGLRSLEIFDQIPQMLPLDLYHFHLDGIHPYNLGPPGFTSWRGRESLRSLSLGFRMRHLESSVDVFSNVRELYLNDPSDILALKTPEEWVRLNVIKLGRWWGVGSRELEVFSRFPALKMIEVRPEENTILVYPEDRIMWESLKKILVGI